MVSVISNIIIVLLLTVTSPRRVSPFPSVPTSAWWLEHLEELWSILDDECERDLQNNRNNLTLFEDARSCLSDLRSWGFPTPLASLEDTQKHLVEYCSEHGHMASCLATIAGGSMMCLNLHNRGDEREEESWVKNEVGAVKGVVEFLCSNWSSRVIGFLSHGGPECLHRANTELHACVSVGITLKQPQDYCRRVEAMKHCLLHVVTKTCDSTTTAEFVADFISSGMSRTSCSTSARAGRAFDDFEDYAINYTLPFVEFTTTASVPNKTDVELEPLMAVGTTEASLPELNVDDQTQDRIHGLDYFTSTTLVPSETMNTTGANLLDPNSEVELVANISNVDNGTGRSADSDVHMMMRLNETIEELAEEQQGTESELTDKYSTVKWRITETPEIVRTIETFPTAMPVGVSNRTANGSPLDEESLVTEEDDSPEISTEGTRNSGNLSAADLSRSDSQQAAPGGGHENYGAETETAAPETFTSITPVDANPTEHVEGIHANLTTTHQPTGAAADETLPTAWDRPEDSAVGETTTISDQPSADVDIAGNSTVEVLADSETDGNSTVEVLDDFETDGNSTNIRKQDVAKPTSIETQTKNSTGETDFDATDDDDSATLVHLQSFLFIVAQSLLLYSLS